MVLSKQTDEELYKSFFLKVSLNWHLKITLYNYLLALTNYKCVQVYYTNQ